MAFTDDELARLKISQDTLLFQPVSPQTVLKLIARLEAAETALNEVAGMHGRPSIEAWRKAAGK